MIYLAAIAIIFVAFISFLVGLYVGFGKGWETCWENNFEDDE